MSKDAVVRKDHGGYYVYLRWQGQRHFFSKYMGVISVRKDKTLATQLANFINSEIDAKIFRPERHKKGKPLALKNYAPKWLEMVSPGLSEATLYDYKNSLKNHILPILGDEYLPDIGSGRLYHLLNHINRDSKGKYNVMGCLKKLIKDAYREGLINQLPIFPEMKGKNQVVNKTIKWAEKNEQFRILENIRRSQRPIFTFIMLTGCRPSEARAFRKQDIKRNHIDFAVTFGRSGELKEVKGKKIMPFPLTEALKELFDSMPKNLTPWVFINPETGKAYSRFFNRIFNRAAKKAGINISLNEFGRKSFAMQMLEHMEKGIVSHLLRHQDPRMIDHYAEYQTNPIKSILDKVQMLSVNSSANSKKGNENK